MITGRIEGIADRFDAVIVGAGPVGLTLASEIRREDRRVLVIESGGLQPTATARALSEALVLDPTIHDDVRICVSRQYGGTSNLWTGRCLPYDRIDFEPRFDNAVWPIAFEDIENYYSKALAYANCGSGFYDEAEDSISDTRFAINHIERYCRDPKIFRARRKAIEADPNISIILNTTVVDFALDEGGVVTHIIARHKNGLSYRFSCKAVVLASGGLEAARLLLSMRRRRADLFGGKDGPLGRYYMGHLFGHLAELTFATDEMAKLFDYRLDGTDAYIRRRIVASDRLLEKGGLPNIAFWPDVPTLSDPRHESAFLSAAYLALSVGPLGRRLTPEVIRRHHAGKLNDLSGHLRNVARDPCDIARQLPVYLKNRYARRLKKPGFFVLNSQRTYRLAYHAEHYPDASSRVTLSDTVDASFLPRLSIDLKIPENNLAAVVRAHRVLVDWLENAGIGRLAFGGNDDLALSRLVNRARHGTHQIGITRMGSNRQDGVVDRNLKIFDLQNAYIASSSVFVTSSQANPTLTAMAFAVRLSEHLCRSNWI
ncbi:GMC oxidoreductase [Rhizobium sp. BE258]|uniref:GMC oxidoreductase n=1 Tax=Rhizobium sp. BE258 TaxID=2817722 RepID=UPI002859DFF0|nr:GMC oxidoreductase [Rhizobium sp. BE258]MDR7145316.1 choline dehydrogenase-like flavoprotein [Rhizobium sp. BE258]